MIFLLDTYTKYHETRWRYRITGGVRTIFKRDYYPENRDLTRSKNPIDRSGYLPSKIFSQKHTNLCSGSTALLFSKFSCLKSVCTHPFDIDTYLPVLQYAPSRPQLSSVFFFFFSMLIRYCLRTLSAHHPQMFAAHCKLTLAM